MSVYDLPTQVTPIFNPLFWEVSDVSLTRQEADDLYLSIFGGQTVPQVESFASGIETNTVEPFGSANTVLNFTTTGNTNFGGNVNIPSGSFYKINNVNLIPSVSGQSGKYLGTDGSQTLWQTVDALPSQTGQSGRYLTTNGSSASWGTVSQISASGSAGYIQYKGSDGGLAASQNLFWSSGTNRLGINNNNPQSALDVTGTLKVTDGTLNLITTNTNQLILSTQSVTTSVATNTFTSNSNQSFTFSATSNNGNAYRAFGGSSGNWQSSANYYFDDGSYAGSSSITISSVSYTGERIAVTFPTSYRIYSMTINNGSDPYGSYARSFVVGGSEDNSAWTLLHSGSLGNGGQTILFSNTNFTTRYLVIVIRTTDPNSLLDSNLLATFDNISFSVEGDSGEFPQVRLQKENNNITILNSEGISVLDRDENPLMNISSTSSYIPKIYYTNPSIPSNAVLYKKSDDEIYGDEFLTWDPDSELMYVAGGVQALGRLTAFSFNQTGRISSSFDDLSNTAVITKEDAVNQLALKQDTLTTSSNVAISTLSLSSDVNTPSNAILYRNESDAVVGSSLMTFSDNTMNVPSLNSNGTITCSGITISGAPSGQTQLSNGLPVGGAAGQFLRKIDATNYTAEWITINQPPGGGTTSQVLAKNSNVDYDYSWQNAPSGGGGSATIQFGEWFQGTEINAAGSGTETRVLWNGTSTNNITGLTINTTTGAISITSAGMYTFSWSIGMNGATSSGSRQTWMRFGTDTQRRGASSATSGGSTIFFIGSSMTYYFSSSVTLTIYFSHNAGSSVAVYGTSSSAPINSTSASKLQITRIA
jgi:hypothetical protein